MSAPEKNSFPPVSASKERSLPSVLKSSNRRFVSGNGVVYLVVIGFSILAGVGILLLDPLIVFGVVGGLVAAIALFSYPFLGVLAYLVYEYASVSQMFAFTQVLQLGKLIILATIVAWVVQGMTGRKLSFVSDKITLWFLLWCVAAVISNLVAINKGLAFQGTVDIFKYFIIYFMIINVVDSLPKWKWSMWVFLILAFRMSQFQLRTYSAGLASTSSVDYFVREGVGIGTTSFFSNAGDFGVFLCVTAPLAFYLIRAVEPKTLKAIGAIFVGFFVVSIIKSGARGNMVGLAATSLLYWWRCSQKVLIGLVLVMLGTVYWVTAPGVVKDRIMSATSYNKDGTATHRLVLWKAGLDMFIANPLTGVGVNNYMAYYQANYATDDDKHRAAAPHNLFVQCISETGLLGITSLLVLIYLVFLRNHQTKALLRKQHRHNQWISSFAVGLDLALVGYLISGSFLTVLYYPHLFLLLALAVSLHSITRKRVEASFDGTVKTEPLMI